MLTYKAENKFLILHLPKAALEMKDTANIEIPYPAYISPLCLPITIGKKGHGVNIKYPINNNPSVNLSEILKVYKTYMVANIGINDKITHTYIASY